MVKPNLLTPKRQSRSKSRSNIVEQSTKKQIKKDTTPQRSVKSKITKSKTPKAQQKEQGKTPKQQPKTPIQQKSVRSRKSPQSKQPQQSVIKEKKQKKEKSPDQGESYMDVIEYYIKKGQKGQKDRKPINNCYTILEDLQIIYNVAQQSALSNEFWLKYAKQQKGPIERTVESLKDRYRRFLKNLDQNQFDMVIDYLENKGIYGYLHFDQKDEKGVRKLIKISDIDPISHLNLKQKNAKLQREKEKVKSDQKQQQVPIKEKKITKFEKKVEKESLKKPSTSQQQVQSIRQMLQKKPIKSQKNCLCGIQSLKKSIKMRQGIFSSTVGDQILKLNLQNNFLELHQIQNQMKDCQSLHIYVDFSNQKRYSEVLNRKKVQEVDSTLDMFASMFGKSKQYIADLLETVSGESKDLIECLETGRDTIRWSIEDDNALKACRNPDEPIFKILLRTKGEGRIRRRCEFKQIVLPFKF